MFSFLPIRSVLDYFNHLIHCLLSLFSSLTFPLKLLKDTSDWNRLQQPGLSCSQWRFKTPDDEYLLVWRIVKTHCALRPYPVLLQHGLLDSGLSWLAQPNKMDSLPFILAEQGYEVWIGNNRGNRHCPTTKDYCLDHLILYDQPTLIQGVLSHSTKQKLIYIGHSQGSTQFVLALKAHPQLAQRIHCFVGLGTITTLDHIVHPLLKWMSKLNLMDCLGCVGVKSILVFDRKVRMAIAIGMHYSKMLKVMVMGIINAICGTNAQNKIPMEMLSVIVSTQPGGASVSNVAQWIQCFRKGKLRKYDYGCKQNMHIYGSEVPPIYCIEHLKQLSFKTLLVYGDKDAVMSEKNFKQLVSKFNEDNVKTMTVCDYHHLDYLWSNKAKQDIYLHVLAFIVEQQQQF